MEAYWIWWMAAVVLVIAEMLSGTFYLLAVSLGLSFAGFSAYMGANWEVQSTVAALFCTVSIAAIYRWRQGQKNEETNLAYDIGQTVQLVSWSGDRNARVSYRGAEWTAELADTATPDSSRQSWKIKQIIGSLLVIE